MALHHKQIGSLAAGKHSDGNGLRFIAKGDGTGRWEVRYSVGGKRRDAGLGTFPAVSLKQARDAAQGAREAARKGLDVSRKGKGALAPRQALTGRLTVRDAMPTYLTAHEQNISSPADRVKYAKRAEMHVVAPLGDVSLEDVTIDDLVRAYGGMWHLQRKTLRHILDIVRGLLNWAHRRGVKVDRQVVADFQDEMGKSRYVAGTLGEMHWQDAAAVYQTLGEHDSHVAARIHAIVCTRIGPVVRARWQDILDADGNVADVWAVPRNFMKGSKVPGEENLPLDKQRPPHLVPVTPELRRLFEMMLARRFRDNAWVFARFGTKLPHMRPNSVSEVLGKNANTHGFRHSFSSWAEDTNSADRRLIDKQLAHGRLPGARENYAKAQMVERRRESQEKWENYLTGSQVVKLRQNVG